MSPEQLSTLAKENIIQARIRMLLREPFFGTLATRLKVIDASQWCQTAATDGRHFYYNVEFISKLDEDEMVFLVAHEVLHAVYDHIDRRGGRDPKLWNIAADFAINFDLVEAGFKLISRDDIKPCYDTKYGNKTTEEIYDLLLEDQKNGKKPEEKYKPLDHHMDKGDDGDGDDGEGDPTGKTGPVPLSGSDRQQIDEEIKQAVMQAAELKDSHGNGAPGRIRRMIESMTEPKMDWKEYLNKQIQSSVQSDFTWQRCSRKTQAAGIYLPAQQREPTIRATVGIDSSGSINETMFRMFLSEVYGIMQQFASYEIEFFCWDAKCYTLHRFTEDNGEDILSVDLEGGGGNDGTGFVWDFLEENEVVPDNMIMFTDGYIMGPWDNGTPPEFAENTLWVLWGKENNPPWGDVVRFDDL